jgi:hypothetical protein
LAALKAQLAPYKTPHSLPALSGAELAAEGASGQARAPAQVCGGGGALSSCACCCSSLKAQERPAAQPQRRPMLSRVALAVG